MTCLAIFIACMTSTFAGDNGTAQTDAKLLKESQIQLNQAELDQLLRDGIVQNEKLERARKRSKIG